MSTVTTTQVTTPAETLFAFALLGVIAILMVPLPAAALDGLLALNIAVSVLMLLIAVSLTRPLDFSVFPSLLLVTTLLRLGLNVATTRLILLHGSQGAGAAGHVIETFGRFVVGGSLVVGAVVFLILLVVNFAVITKGSGRVSEVAARFTLDALPGKQMSIDADLSAGIIDDREARSRRARLEAETEFFGAMDGASKFVRGDAVAGLAITGINIVGGLALGLGRDHLSLAQAVDTYTILTIGDGLVSQLPALLVSTAAGITVTRAAGSDLGTQVVEQLFGRERVLESTAIIMGGLGLVPGMPLLPFALLGAGSYALSRRARGRAASPPAPPANEPGKPERLQDMLALDAVELAVGYALQALLDAKKDGELPARVTALRKQLASDLGVVLPPVHLCDDLRLEPDEYRVRVRGLEVARGVAYADRLMALDPQGAPPAVEGIAAKEPAFGLPAVWVPRSHRALAEQAGLTIVDPASVLTTHLSEVLRRHAHELVGRQEVQELLGLCAKETPKLVEDVVPATVSLGELVRVVRGLLREGVSVRDLRTVLEAVADAAARSKETGFLVEQVRRRLARQITSRLVGPDGVVQAVVFDRASEDALRQGLGQSDGEVALALDVDVARQIIRDLEQRASQLAAAGRPAVVLAPPDLRRALFDFASRFVPDLNVVTAREVVPGTTIERAATLQLAFGVPSQFPESKSR